MKERIILAPGLNGTEMTRSLALHGVNTSGYRFCNAVDLARMALMHSGISVAEDFLSGQEETAFIARAVEGEAYFNKTTAPTYADVKKIAAAVRQMRFLVEDEDETAKLAEILPQGIFKEKNEALLHVYQQYMGKLREAGLIDAASLVRRAAFKAEQLDAEFVTLSEFPLRPLEKKLLERVSGSAIEERNVQWLYGAESKPLHIESYKNCYGAPNEVEWILADIYSGRQLDECTIAVTDPATYSQLFFDYAVLYNIPITFGCGIPISNSNPARLLTLYLRWMTDGFFGAAAIKNMLSSDAFNRNALFSDLSSYGVKWEDLYKAFGDIRLQNDAEENVKRLRGYKKALHERDEITPKDDSRERKDLDKMLKCEPLLDIPARELALPVEEFIRKYAFCRSGEKTIAEQLAKAIDSAAASSIVSELTTIRNTGLGQPIADIIPDLLGRMVSVQSATPGKIHLTSIDGAFAVMRKNLFIAGMSSGKYPGHAKENYLLLDCDLELFGEGAQQNKADERVIRKGEQLDSLVKLSSALDTRTAASWPGFDVGELKKSNPSSLVYKLFADEHGANPTSDEAKAMGVGYFDPPISNTRLIGKSYVAGHVIQQDPAKPRTEEPVQCELWEKGYSPSALELFFQCPRRFMLKYILGIEEPEDDNPLEVISGGTEGTLLHAVLAEHAKSPMSLDAFLELSDEYFDRYIDEHPPFIPAQAKSQKTKFRDLAERTFHMEEDIRKENPGLEVVLGEQDIKCLHESGITIHGRLDRVEKFRDGTYRIVDFKTNRKEEHKEDDIDTCLQVVIYAYLWEHEGEGHTVSGCEYRNLRKGRIIPCKYDDEMKEKLLGKLNDFKAAMDTGNFPISEYATNRKDDDPDPCKYCKFGGVCGKSSKEANSNE